MNEKERTLQQQALFCADFEKRTGESVSAIELVSLEATPENLKKLKLEYPPAQFCIWGLLVICKSQAVYFFSHAQDFAIMGFKPTNSDTLSAKEQLVCIASGPAKLNLSLPVHNFWLNRILAPNNVILAETANGAVFTVKTMKKAVQVLERLSDYVKQK